MNVSEGRKSVARNRKARHEFEILDTYEVGIVLKGPEVKSLRAGEVSFQDAFAHMDRVVTADAFQERSGACCCVATVKGVLLNQVAAEEGTEEEAAASPSSLPSPTFHAKQETCAQPEMLM